MKTWTHSKFKGRWRIQVVTYQTGQSVGTCTSRRDAYPNLKTGIKVIEESCLPNRTKRWHIHKTPNQTQKIARLDHLHKDLRQNRVRTNQPSHECERNHPTSKPPTIFPAISGYPRLSSKWYTLSKVTSYRWMECRLCKVRDLLWSAISTKMLWKN